MTSTTYCARVLAFPQGGQFEQTEPRTPEPKEPPYNPRNRHHETDITNNRFDNNNNYYPRVRGHACVGARTRARIEPPEDAEKIYRECFGFPVSEPVRKQMAELMATTGIDAEMMIAVMEYTAVMAPRPSWRYAVTVIRNQVKLGCTTAQEFAENCRQYQTPPRTQPGKTVIEQQYSQREYNAADYEGLTPEEIEEAMRYEP